MVREDEGIRHIAVESAVGAEVVFETVYFSVFYRTKKHQVPVVGKPGVPRERIEDRLLDFKRRKGISLLIEHCTIAENNMPPFPVHDLGVFIHTRQHPADFRNGKKAGYQMGKLSFQNGQGIRIFKSLRKIYCRLEPAGTRKISVLLCA